MPRIIPLSLLKCLKVLLDDNGGILGSNDVERIASLMTKYSKKLVSKCIYVQILKSTKTDLVDKFMDCGGWSLVNNWLSDAIRGMNWPLVQEILELLLLCPVDVMRLKINTAPKIVKNLCRDGGNEGVRILARRLVEQWLKVVTENDKSDIKLSSIESSPSKLVDNSPTIILKKDNTPTIIMKKDTSPTLIMKKEKKSKTVPGPPGDAQVAINDTADNVESDPLGEVDDAVPEPTTYDLTLAQKKANESGLKYKIVVKDGQQVLTKICTSSLSSNTSVENPEKDNESEIIKKEPFKTPTKISKKESDNLDDATIEAIVIEDSENENENHMSESKNIAFKEEDESIKKSDSKDSVKDIKVEDSSKIGSRKVEEKPSKSEKSNKTSSEKTKDKKSSKDKDYKSSSSHKSAHSSEKSKSSGTHQSSKEKHRDSKSKERSSTSKDKESRDKSKESREEKIKEPKEEKSKEPKNEKSKETKQEKSSSSKRRSSSSSKSSSLSTSKSHAHEKDKEKSSKSTALPSISSSSSLSLSLTKKEKVREEKEPEIRKEKESMHKLFATVSVDKTSKTEKKVNSKEEEVTKPTSIIIPSKKASISIEIRRDHEKPSAVKTYKSQFRSHGLNEEAPPPPSRRGLKKPISSTNVPVSSLTDSGFLPPSLKRSPPTVREVQPEKRTKTEILAQSSTVTTEKPHSVKLIPPKKMQTLVETNLFSDALSAASGTKKVTKRKRPSAAPSQNATAGTADSKLTPLKFYQDTLSDDSVKVPEKTNQENVEVDAKNNSKAAAIDADEDDIPLKMVKEDIDKMIKETENKKNSTDAIINLEDDDDDMKEEKKQPGPGCGPGGPPGVLILHRRKGPKKKLSWKPQEQLEQVHFFELDETERVNVTRVSFSDMKNLERVNERDAILSSRRSFNDVESMDSSKSWTKVYEVDGAPYATYGKKSKERRVQVDREKTTLRALYFSSALIPETPTEAELEPHHTHDIRIIPLDDITGNPDAVNDFSAMIWPDWKTVPKADDYTGTGGLMSFGTDPMNMFGGPAVSAQFNQYMSTSFRNNQMPVSHPPIQQPPFQIPPSSMHGQPPNALGIMNAPMMGNQYNNMNCLGLDVNMMGPNGSMNTYVSQGPPPQNFMNPGMNGQFNSPHFMSNPPPFSAQAFGPNGPNFGFVPNTIMNNMGPGPMCMPRPLINGSPLPPNRNISANRNNNGGSWRTGGSNFQENAVKSSNSSGGSWRQAMPGNLPPFNSNKNNNNNSNNNGICKNFMRGHCRQGKTCKYVHPRRKRL